MLALSTSGYERAFSSSSQRLQSPTMSFVSPTKRRVPPQPYTPRHRLPSQPPRQPIWFDYAGARPEQGVPMRELRLKGTALPMSGALDPVLGGSGLQKIVFRINVRFPFLSYNYCVLTGGAVLVAGIRTRRVVPQCHHRRTKRRPISRVALAMQIATNYTNWYESSSNDWLLSPRCVEFKHLHLVSLINTFKDFWQADVALDV
ncbi:hypothetical protein MKEN_00858800 [Mycena kentingensis (nom. inval.)]|nr:hypothetical protein MKEN_00858800 [Mycena kentingensis (nom. inval.)]